MGKITTAHGIKGLVKIIVHIDDPHILDQPLHTSETGADTIALTVKSAAGKFLLAEVAGVTDRNAAEALRGTELWLDRAGLPQTENENEYYIADLIGMNVVNDQGTPVGTVIAVDNFGAGDLLDIRPPEGESFYLPFTKDTIMDVDLAGKAITVIVPGEV